ncbi:MAG: hypothetical protein C4297_03595 [Gemmataceae bacterium]
MAKPTGCVVVGYCAGLTIWSTGLIALVLLNGSARLEPHASASAPQFFKIKVVDEQTGRGVPLVELRTVHHLTYVTDNNGVVAVGAPELMHHKVYFHVFSHGYEFPADGFGYRGVTLEVRPGASATVRIKRLNIAERLYRITGAGLYADSLSVGEPIPIRQPLLNAQVLGSDSVVQAVYRGKIHWFWGDTHRLAYPLGNFHVPGATSLLPGSGGLDPEKGVDLQYFTGSDGFARPTAQMPGSGPTWIWGLTVIRDAQGTERMFAGYVKVRPPMTVYERGLAEWNDEKQCFEKVTTFDMDLPLYPDGHTFVLDEQARVYVYFATPFPLVRVEATPEALRDQKAYQAYTCLLPKSDAQHPRVDRDEQGRLRYAWRSNTPAVRQKEQADLIARGLAKPEELLVHLQDIESGKQVLTHSGSVYWNAYRRRWIMIAVQEFGTSFLGEVWYAEADAPLGPWVYARKIVTHDRYSFYNPKHHPVFDQDGGRRIYFEGTYTRAFSGNEHPTPRYDYNQIMYRLDLADSRLLLPVPVYTYRSGTKVLIGTIEQVPVTARIESLPFLACDRPAPGLVPVYVREHEGRIELERNETDAPASARPVFYVAAQRTHPAVMLPLYALRSAREGACAFHVGPLSDEEQQRMHGKLLGYVWRSPLRWAPEMYQELLRYRRIAAP